VTVRPRLGRMMKRAFSKRFFNGLHPKSGTYTLEKCVENVQDTCHTSSCFHHLVSLKYTAACEFDRPAHKGSHARPLTRLVTDGRACVSVVLKGVRVGRVKGRASP